MPVNHYFQSGNGIGNTAEQRLHEDLIIEGLRIYGHMVYYLPRTVVNKDLILGEDVASRFKSAFPIEAYFETTEGFAGQQELINKFGLEIREDTTFMISKRRFDLLVDSKTTLIKEGRPNEGDIIYMPLTQSLFEIRKVDSQSPFFQVGKLFVFRMSCELMQYSNEVFNTGINIIDDTYNALLTTTDPYVLTGENGSYFTDENGYDILGEDYNIGTLDTSSQNDFFESEGIDFLDFSERDPFSELERRI